MDHQHNHSHDSGEPKFSPASADPYAAHSHDGSVSNPAMARRFWVALVLSVPILWFSGHVPGLHSPLPEAGHVKHIVLFVLTTPVVFYGGSVFVTGALRALRARTLDMSVLIATGVLAAYLASVYLSFTPAAAVFYEAAALLVTFVLFGHWMEEITARNVGRTASPVRPGPPDGPRRPERPGSRDSYK